LFARLHRTTCERLAEHSRDASFSPVKQSSGRPRPALPADRIHDVDQAPKPRQLLPNKRPFSPFEATSDVVNDGRADPNLATKRFSLATVEVDLV
jgi:hypothetical protein